MDAEKYKAKFSNSYTLHLEKRADSRWRILIDGPFQLVTLQGAPTLVEAMAMAYDICTDHFGHDRILESHVNSHEIEWHNVFEKE